MKKRLPALLLILAMLFTIVPTAALADESAESADPGTGNEPQSISPFADVQDSTAYYYDPVLWASGKGIVYGMSDTEFAPLADCTRAQVVTFLYRAAGEPSVTGIQNPFTDVKSDAWYYDAVRWGYQNEIVYGMSDTTFSPDSKVTRAQFVTFLYRFAGSPVTTGTCPFGDAAKSSWYYDAVLWGYRNQIVYGVTDTMFGSDSSCTRGQVVTFLYRYYNESAAPADPDTVSELCKQLSGMIGGYSGSWSVYFKRLDTGESFSIHDTPMVSASLIKLYVYGAAYRQFEAGTLSYSTYSNSMKLMISASDNSSCNYIVSAIGGVSAVNEFVQAQGWKDTQMNRKMLEYSQLENYTSVSECGELLEQVYNGTYVSTAASADLLSAMLSQYKRTKIPAGIPYGTKCANKTGELSDVENDAAIVYSPACDYILVVMSDDIAALTAQLEIREISKAVYNYLNEEQ